MEKYNRSESDTESSVSLYPSVKSNLRDRVLGEVVKDLLVAQMVKNLPAMRETWIRSLGWEDPL